MARNSREPASGRVRGICGTVIFAAAALIFVLIAGCAAPGVPVTRQPRVPRAISDLSARQSGDSILLSFTFPTETAQGRKLSRTPGIEIYRAFTGVQTGAETAQPEPQLAVTIPPQMTGKYLQDGEIRFTDALAPEEIATHSGNEAVYEVRTRLGKHESADSNVVRVRIFPAPSAIRDLRAQITQTAVELSWTAPAVPGEGSAAAKGIRYRVYRAEVETGNSAANGANGGRKNEAKSGPVLLGETSGPGYSDTTFEFGRTYGYSVRGVAVYEAGSVESAESNMLQVTPRDTFAPAAPTGLVATGTAATRTSAAHVDLSWAINSENDLQGYNVYRSESESSAGTKLNATPLLTPVFRDDAVEAGKKYFYRVTAVDRAGNESAASAIVSVSVPASDEKNP
jgi:hypothetical protein